MRTILTPNELQNIERERGQAGVSAREVIDLFQRRGVRLSEGTFRKYVQVGLLPRSRRVGSKGKHRGSHGVYPASVVRRVNAIKAMMAEGMTLEQIRGSFLSVRGELDMVEQGLSTIRAQLADALDDARFEPKQRERLSDELEAIRASAEKLTNRIERLASRIVASRVALAEYPEGT